MSVSDKHGSVKAVPSSETDAKQLQPINQEDVSQKVQDYNEACKAETETLVLQVFPQIILSLDALLRDPQFQPDRATDIANEVQIPLPKALAQAKDDELAGFKSAKRSQVETIAEVNGQQYCTTKMYYFLDGPVGCNKKLLELADQVKPHVRELVYNANRVKMWIVFLIPRIEDGNNFGVSVQEECLSKITTVESDATSFMEQMRNYCVDRGHLVADLAKYPHVDDYRQAIRDLDEEQFHKLRLTVMGLHDIYSGMYDLIKKNLAKIKMPRGSNNDTNDSLYYS